MADLLEPNADPQLEQSAPGAAATGREAAKAQVEAQLMEMLGVQDASREDFEAAILETLRQEQEAHKELSRQLQYQSKTEAFYAGACGIGATVSGGSVVLAPAAPVLLGVGAVAGGMAYVDDMQATYHANEAADLAERIAVLEK